MADDDAGGTVLGFPGLTIPGPVGGGPPLPGAHTPSLTALPVLAPPPSLMVAGTPTLNGGNPAAVNADPGIPDSPQGTGIAAMSVVMMAGITVAAMRGAWNAAAYLKARHEHHRAIADQARAAADKATLGGETARQKGRVQPGPEFGRSTRTSGGGGLRTNSGKNSTPGTFRSSGGPKTPGGSGARTPGKTPGGGSGGRTGTLGANGRGGGPGSRSGALRSSGTNGGGKAGTGGTKTATSGTKSGSGGLAGAVRDRAADRIRNGPRPKTPTPTSPASRTPGIRDAARGRVADRIGNGPTPKAPTTGSGTKTTPPTKPDRGPRIRDAARARVADRITTGAWTPTGRKPVSLTKGSGPSPTSATIRGALRQRAVDRILNGKKATGAPTAPGGSTVDLTKKPKVDLIKKRKGSGPGGATPTRVDLTKKPRPTPGSGGAAGTGTTTPKVNLHKKVNLRKTRRYSRPTTTGPKPTGTAGTGPAAGSARRGGWERVGARRSERASTGQPGSTGTGTGAGPGPGAGGVRFGPPPGWGHTEGYTVTIERADGGPGSQVRRRPAGAITRGRPGLPAGTSRGGSPVTVPVPMKAPNTQYADSELTIFDVIESDEDMAEEIMQGVDEARAAAEGCDVMMTRLESLHAKIVDLKVPGVLEGWVLLLAEKSASVKARAEALAEKLPAASEAIRTAGENAERRHKPLADAVRDAGHTAPAEREYHIE